MNRIAVLTSGGDAPGMNACIRAITRRALASGCEAIGIEHGFDGLIGGEIRPLAARDVGNIIQRGGTILGSSRSTAFRSPEGRELAARRLKDAGIEGLVVCGGNGSLAGAHALMPHWGGGIVGVPTSIDNDIHGTDTTIGFDTAVNTAVDAIDRVRDTAEAQERVFLVEVMGRACGAIALEVALAAGAVAVLLPESHRDIGDVEGFLRSSRASGRRSSIIIVAEGEEHGGAFEVARALQPLVQTEIRVTVLGHIQRGGAPTAVSRVLGTRLGVAAVDALLSGMSDVMAGVRGGGVVLVPLADAASSPRPADTTLLELVLGLAG